MRISACPQCGSKNIYAGKMSSGILFGVSSWMEECRDCGYKGSPIIFESEQKYASFLKKLREGKTDESVETDMEECVLDDVDEEGISYHWHQGKWWLEILVASVVATLVSVTGVWQSTGNFGIGVGLFYTFLVFIMLFIFILIGIIIIEYVVILVINFFRKKRKNC